jgi:hypothetical protein
MLEELDPYEALDLDLRLDQLEKEAQGGRLTTDEVAAAMREATEILASHGITVPPRGVAEPVTLPPRSFALHFEPLATLAASDYQIGSTRWQDGVLRLLLSPLRPDVLVELSIDGARRSDYEDCAFVVSLGEGLAVTLLADASPVFTGLTADALRKAPPSAIEAVPLAVLSEEQRESLRRSRGNLRDPASIALYDTAIERTSPPREG